MLHFSSRLKGGHFDFTDAVQPWYLDFCCHLSMYEHPCSWWSACSHIQVRLATHLVPRRATKVCFLARLRSALALCSFISHPNHGAHTTIREPFHTLKHANDRFSLSCRASKMSSTLLPLSRSPGALGQALERSLWLGIVHAWSWTLWIPWISYRWSFAFHSLSCVVDSPIRLY